MTAQPSPWRGWRWLYAAVWLPFLTLYLTLFAAGGMSWVPAFRGALANVLPEALLGLAVLKLPRRLPWRARQPLRRLPVQSPQPQRRLPFEDDDRARFFVVHAALLAAFVLAANAGWVALVLVDNRLLHGAVKLGDLFRLLPWRVLNDLQIYCGLVGLAYAWQNAARASHAEALQAQAELQALRSQLNPHFILNTFHALVGLVRREPAVAEAALEQLGDLLRYSLRIEREGLDEVTLRDEWAFVRSYLDLEALRLGDRLRVAFDAGDDTLDCIVPSFALQTLVENAIRHAIAPRAAGGRLAVSARRVDGRLRIRVEDDGPGIGEMSDDDRGDDRGHGQGVGLRLLRERLAALHGEGARLTLESGPAGLGAVLDLPARPLEDDE